MENEIDLEKKIKELDNALFKVGQSAQTVHMLTKPQAFYDNIHKQALGYQNPFHLKKAQRIKPTLYEGIVISDKHVAMPVIDDEETLILEEEIRSKMSEKEKDLEAIKQIISHKPIDYEKINRLFDDSPKELPKVSLVNESLKKLKFHLARFDNVVKIRTTPDARTEDVLLTVMNSMSLIGEFVNMDRKINESCDKCSNLEAELLKSQNAHNDLLKKFLENNDLKAQLQDKDTTICKLKDIIKSMREKSKDENVNYDYVEIETKNVELENRGIVEQAKAKQPLDKELDFACKHAQRIQELLVYVRDTCPNAIKLNEKEVDSSKTSDSNIPVLSPTGLKCSTNVKHSLLNANSEAICATCKKSMFDGVHDRITSAYVVPPKKTTSNSVETQKQELKVYSRKPKNVKIVGSSKKAKIVESKNANHSEPNHTWGSNATDIPSSSDLVMTVRFGNDPRIMGYGDYQLGNVTISRVYYVEGDAIVVGLQHEVLHRCSSSIVKTQGGCYRSLRK
ncbi:hypothetical protein Tco_0045702 [Tanacetum coccineum]